MLPSNLQAAARLALLRAKAQFGSSFIYSISALRMEQAISAAQNNYNFQVKDPGTVSADGTIQFRLNDNDAFIPVGIALGLKKFTTTSPGSYPIYTFPDPGYFSTASQAGALESVYNGTLLFKTGSTVRIDNIPTNLLRYAPENQYKVKPTGTAATSVVVEYTIANDAPPSFGPSLEEKGFLDLANYPILNGSEQNLWTLQLGLATTTAVGTDVNLVLQNYGILIKGAAAAAQKWNGWLQMD